MERKCWSRTMPRHNCTQQALEAASVCTIPKEHAREEEENEVRRMKTVLGSQWPRSSITSPSQRAPHSSSSSIVLWAAGSGRVQATCQEDADRAHDTEGKPTAVHSSARQQPFPTAQHFKDKS